MRWASVEWGSAVARVYQAQATPLLLEYGIRVVLPDLPRSILSRELQREFLAHIPPSLRVQTICASRFDSPRALQHHVQHGVHANHVLIVGGNDKDQSTGRLSSIDAIRALSQWSSSAEEDSYSQVPLKVWGVANPNCPASVDSVRAKVEAGATGIITQPLWSAGAVDRVHQYAATASHNISLAPRFAVSRFGVAC
jgi:5,10-methylenetetrahydrofolate reductase